MNSIIDNQLDHQHSPRVAVLIPDRGDRPQFMQNCLRMMDEQTLRPTRLVTMGYPPESNHCDITQRYRRGYNHLTGKDLELIVFIENDDWYHPQYLEMMYNKWVELGKPELIGTSYTIYYHLRLRKYYTLNHQSRASMMNTAIKPDLNMAGIWPIDIEPFTDMALWNSRLKKKVFTPEKHYSIGMKHGIGKTGGRAHTTRLENYDKRGLLDNGFLRETLDRKSFEFYNTVFLEPDQEDFIVN